MVKKVRSFTKFFFNYSATEVSLKTFYVNVQKCYMEYVTTVYTYDMFDGLLL